MSAGAMCMHEVWFFGFDQPFYLFPFGKIEGLCGMNDMRGDAHIFKALYHRSIGEGKYNRVENIFVEIFYQVEQVAFAAADLSLPYSFKDSYFLGRVHLPVSYFVFRV